MVSLGVHASALSALLYLGARDQRDYLADDSTLGEVTLQPADPAARNAAALDLPLPETSLGSPTPPDAHAADEPPPEPQPIDLTGLSTTLPTSTATSILGAGSAPATSSLLASPTGATRQGAAVAFAGLRSQAATRIVYAVDASGAVVSSFRFLQDKLRQSIDRLAPSQRFDVVFFQNRAERDDPYLLLADDLIPATPTNQQAAARWIDAARPAGRSDPLDGLRPALAMKPDLVFLLSTSIPRTNAEWGAGRDAILAELDRLNPIDPRTGKRPVVIKTIQFLHEDPSGLMRDIAQLHGDGEGSHRTLRVEELNAEPEEDDVTLDLANPTEELVIAAAAARLGSAERDGSVLSTLFAAPLPEQAEAAEHAARQALDLLAAVEESESADVRAAMLRARAAVILATLSTVDTTRQALARTALLNAQGRPLNEPAAETARRITRVLALSLLAEGPAAHADADQLLRDLAADDADPAQLAEAALALARVAPDDPARAQADAVLERLAQRPPASTDALWALVFAQARARLALTRDEHDPGAFDPLLELLADARLIADDAERRSLVYRALSAAVDRAPRPVDWSRTPPEPAFARAVVVGRTREGRDEALDLLARVADHPGSGPLAPEALWEAAVLRRLDNTEQAQRDASALLARLATEHPSSPRAANALAASINEARAPDGNLPDSFQLDLVRRAIERFPERPEIDVWRLDYARRVAGAERLDALEPVAPGTRQSTLAAELYFPTARSLMHDASPAQRTRLLERSVAFAQRLRRPEWAPLSFELARDLLDTDAARAASIAQTLLRSDAALAQIDPSPDAARDAVALTLAQARLSLGDHAGAFDLARSIAERLEASADRSESFWHAWSIMLEVLSTRDDPDTLSRARSHLARLRLVDPNLGGPPWSSRLSRLADRLHSTP